MYIFTAPVSPRYLGTRTNTHCFIATLLPPPSDDNEYKPPVPPLPPSSFFFIPFLVYTLPLPFSSFFLLPSSSSFLPHSRHPSGLFPDNMVHLGGDEVTTTCWSQTPSIQAWLTARNMTADDDW